MKTWTVELGPYFEMRRVLRLPFGFALVLCKRGGGA
jgi:hypothetical protein